jgi:hypothetical protein
MERWLLGPRRKRGGRGIRAGARVQRISGLQGGGMERIKSRRRIQTCRKSPDERFHGGMPKAIETEIIHFACSLLGGPFFKDHAISSDKDAGAIIAEMAVDENLLTGIVAKKREELDELFVVGRVPTIDGDMDEMHAEGFREFALRSNPFGVFGAEIDDRHDSQLLQLRKTLIPGLRAAIENVGDFSAIGDAGNMKFLAMSRFYGRRRGSIEIGLRRECERHKETESEEGESASHDRSDAKSVAQEQLARKLLKARRLSGKSTTTNRRGTKMSTTFSVFLLTENFLPLILRFQIRGTWKRQTD